MKPEDQRSITVGTQSYDAMWASIAARAAIKEPPAGAMSAVEFAKLSNRTIPSAKRFLHKEELEGRMESDNYKVRVSGQQHTVRLYVPIASPKKSITKHV